MGNIERCWVWEHRNPLDGQVQRGVMFHEPDASRALLDKIEEFVPASDHRGAVAENRKLWARDHARGHKPTLDCPVCVKFGLRPNSPDGGRSDAA